MNTSRTRPIKRNGKAVVIGAGIGGLLAARALSETYKHVSIIDRDELPAEPRARRGVPQGQHLHILLGRGREVLDEFFPGFSDEVTAHGAPSGDSQLCVRMYNDGHLIRPGPSGLIAVGASRPLIEHLIRAHILSLSNVEIIRQDVTRLAADDDRRRIVGVHVREPRDSSSELFIGADIVVDSSGSRSRAPIWLKELGYPGPVEEQIWAHITYVTRHFRRKPEILNGRLGVGHGAYPGQLRGGYALAQEGDRFALTLTGVLGEDPPMDPQAMTAYAASLTCPDVLEVLRSAEPLDKGAKMRFPASIRRRYDKLRRFPDGFLVIGDALCRFNPVYGQGMTVAAMEALLLRDLLAGNVRNVTRRYFRDAIKLTNSPWEIATGTDLRFPKVEGERTIATKVLNEYLTRYHRAAAADAELGTAILGVANLVHPPSYLFKPRFVWKVLQHARATSK